MKVLFVGNSLAYHGEAPELGWYGNHGMAASSKENDFVHVLTRMIEAKCGPVETMVAGGVKVEREPAAVTAEDFAHLRAFDPDIIVARLCENVPAGQLEAFGKAYVRMLRAIDPEQNAKIFCTGSYWPSKEADLRFRPRRACAAAYMYRWTQCTVTLSRRWENTRMRVWPPTPTMPA
ncbi:MAG: SGNH/GDSL hydrolase family protein [Hydrogeniiclostridium mannosilyticum]